MRNKNSLISYETYCPGELFFVLTEDNRVLSRSVNQNAKDCAV